MKTFRKQNPFADTSAYPIHYQTGGIKMDATDMTLPGGAANFFHWRRYNNLNGVSEDGTNGFGWKTRSLPKLTETDFGDILVEFFGGKKVRFLRDAQGKPVSAGNQAETIRLDESGQYYLVDRADQSQWTFRAPDSKDGAKGSLVSIVASDGNATRFVYGNDGNLTRVQTYRTDAPNQTLAELEYEYTPEKRIGVITQRLYDDANDQLTAVKRVRYSYYRENEEFGNPGDLKTVVKEIGDGTQWIADGTAYYRYYKADDKGGKAHMLQFAVGPTDYSVLVEKFGETGIDRLDQETLLPWATKYYEYDAKNRVAKEIVEHGTKTITLEYASFPKSGDPNAVCFKTVEKQLGGESNVIYMNNRGYTLLKEILPPDGSEEKPVINWRVFDHQGRVLQHYHSNVILGYKLVDNRLEVEVAPDEGMIETREYYEGDPSNKIRRKSIQHGRNGSPITLASWERRKNGDKIENHPDAKTEYVDEAGKETITTRFETKYHPNTKKLRRKTMLLPIVSEEEHGDGKQVSQTDIFDTKGRTLWSMDVAGVISHSIYNERTGKLMRQITDVDTDKTADFGTPLPEDWKTPNEAGKHDVTDYMYDFKGRLIQTTQPESEGIDDKGKLVRCRPVSWTVYDDAARTVRSASGYLELDDAGNTVQTVLVNPVSIAIHDADGNFTDQIQASRKNLEGPLMEKDRFEQDSYISWTKNIYRFGKLVAMRQYHAIPECGEGVLGDCYAETTFDYDLQGRQVRTVSPSGAIQRTVYDARSNAVQSWIGTNDLGATDTSPNSGDPANDMRLVNETVYGRGGDCASCGGGAGDRVLVQVQYLEDGKSRVTEYKYDWRGRQVETLGDEDEKGNALASVQYYDNLDRIVKTEQFLCREDKKTKRGQQRLVARTEMSLNARGQTWKSEQSIVDPKKGEVKRKVHSESWFDAAGRTVKQKQGGRRGFSVSEFKPNGELKRAAQLSDSGEILAESQPILDRRGRNVGGMQKSRRVKGRKQGRHVLPKDFGADQTSASRYTRQWFDPAGRSIAMGDYGFVEADAQPVLDYVPQSSETVRVSKTVYDPETGRVLGYIDSEGRETRTEVDAMGRTVKTIANFKGHGVFNPEKPEENITTEMRYDIAGNLVWQRDPTGRVTQQVYDKLGKLLATIAPNGGRTTYEYDQTGQTISVTDPMGRTTRFEYDSQGRRTKTILPKPAPGLENPVQETVYNELGQVEAQIDPLGNKSCFEYDEMGRTVRQIDANGGVTAFQYDDEGKLLSLTDPVGNTTRYEYEELGRVEKETNELGKSRLFEYTPSGALLEKTDRNGRVTAFKYTRFGQVAEERWLTGKRLVGRICFAYDHSGKLTRVSDSSGTFEYTHDVLGRPVVETVALVGFKQKVTLQNSFDVLGRRTSQTALIGQREDSTNRWTYGDNGQVETISHGGPSIEPKQAVYSYDKAGERVGVAVSAGENEVYRSELAYDGMGRLEGIHYVNPASETLARYGLTWDPASRITAMNLDGEPAKYSYDATSQLTSATYESLPAEAYEYDANGNRKNFETGKNNQLTFDGEYRYTYDEEGNRITKGKTRYFWDHRNRLIKIVTAKKTVEYQYDYRNRLTRRNDEFFVHDGWQIVCSLKNGKVVDRYLWGARQDELLCENDDFSLVDHLGTIRKVVGKTVSELEYDAFGKLISCSGKLPRFRYTGKLFDDDTGLQWNINRWYDPGGGRWCSEDPIGFWGDDLNLYRNSINNYISKKDMNGLWKANIHNTKTYQWCLVVPSYTAYRTVACKAIADADEATDNWISTTSPLLLGTQHYHFNRNGRTSLDSRMEAKNKHMAKARELCSKIPHSERAPEAAAENIGLALHALQDYYAHGDYGMHALVWITTIHNYYGPVLTGATGSPKDYPDDPALDAKGGVLGRPVGSAIKTKTIAPWDDPLAGDSLVDYAEYEFGTKRITHTENDTKAELRLFYNYLKNDPSLCECRKFFTFL